MPHFKFDKDQHVYGIEPGPAWRTVPSVTQVLEATGISPDLSFLDPWYLERGRAIHEAMALELVGELDWRSLDDRIRPFIEHARDWLDVLQVTPLVVEHRWVHRIHEYGGTLDLFAESKLGPILIDWKTVIMDASYDIQVAGGYEPLLLEAAEEGAVAVAPGDVRAARIAVVTLGTAMPKAHWISRDSQPEIFRAALAVHQWRNQHRS